MTLNDYLEFVGREEGVDVEMVWERIGRAIALSIIAGEGELTKGCSSLVKQRFDFDSPFNSSFYRFCHIISFCLFYILFFIFPHNSNSISFPPISLSTKDQTLSNFWAVISCSQKIIKSVFWKSTTPPLLEITLVWKMKSKRVLFETCLGLWM